MALVRSSARSPARPNATQLFRQVVADMVQSLPELAHVRPSRILFVAGEARRGSRATIKPLGGKGHPRVTLEGRRVLYCITLRPRFFRSSTLEERVATLLHELLHASPAFDGTLSPERRHEKIARARYAQLIAPLLTRYLACANPRLLKKLGHDGEVLARQWLERPTGKAARRVYTEEDLFLGPVEMLTARKKMH